MAHPMDLINLDYGFDNYAYDKANEIDEIKSPYKGSGRKSTTRAERRKATAHHKAKNISIAKAKGYKLEKCPRPDKNGKRNVISDNFSSKKFYDSLEIEQQKKLAKREIKNYPHDIVTYEDTYLYPCKLNYFNSLFGEVSYCCSDSQKGITDSVFCLPEKATTSVKEALFKTIWETLFDDNKTTNPALLDWYFL